MFEIHQHDEAKVMREFRNHMVTRLKFSRNEGAPLRFYKLRSLSQDQSRLISSEEVSRCSSIKDETPESASDFSILQDEPPQEVQEDKVAEAILITPKPVRVPTPRRLPPSCKPKTPAPRKRSKTVETEPPIYNTNI